MSDTMTFTRREAVAAMAAAAAAGAVAAPSQLQATEAHRIVRRGTSGYAPKIYTPHEWNTVRALVDEIFPKDEIGGAATEAMVPEFMDTILDLEPNMRTAHRGGLAWLDHECRDRFGKDFVTCAATERHQMLDDIAWPARAPEKYAAGVSWFNSFRDFSATGYWTSEIGVTAIGFMGNTPVMEWTGGPDESYRLLGVEKPKSWPPPPVGRR